MKPLSIFVITERTFCSRSFRSKNSLSTASRSWPRSVVVPTLLGAALGIWLDNRHAGSHSWTLMLLVIGLVIGCLNAWHWVAKEDKEMQEDQEDNNDK